MMMKNFFKYGFFILLIVLLIATLFDTSSDSKGSTSLDSNALIVESNDNIDVDDIETPVYKEDSNIFAKIGAFLSNLIYQISNFIFSLISKLFVNYSYFCLK